MSPVGKEVRSVECYGHDEILQSRKENYQRRTLLLALFGHVLSVILLTPPVCEPFKLLVEESLGHFKWYS